MATFTNQASLSYSRGVTNSNIVVGNLTSVLSVTKSSVGETYEPGGVVTYVVTLINTSASALTGLSVTDDLGAFTQDQQTLEPLEYMSGTVRYFADGVLQPEPQTTAGQSLTFTGIEVPAQGSSVLIYQARVTQYAPLQVGAQIINTVTAQGTGLGPVTASDTVTVAQTPELTIAKSMNPSEVTGGDTLTYSFMIQNYGNTDALQSDQITVTDTFHPVLTGLTVTLDGQTLTPGTDYTYNTTSGEFSTTPGRITVPAATFSRASDGSVAGSPGTVMLTVSGAVRPTA